MNRRLLITSMLSGIVLAPSALKNLINKKQTTTEQSSNEEWAKKSWDYRHKHRRQRFESFHHSRRVFDCQYRMSPTSYTKIHGSLDHLLSLPVLKQFKIEEWCLLIPQRGELICSLSWVRYPLEATSLDGKDNLVHSYLYEGGFPIHNTFSRELQDGSLVVDNKYTARHLVRETFHKYWKAQLDLENTYTIDGH